MAGLYLHIGDSKTGSSSLQSSLYLSRDTLWRDHGLLYPPRRQSGSAPGAITSGNAEGVLANEGSFEHALSEAFRGVPDRPASLAGVVFSSEFLFVELLDAEDLAFLPEVAARHGVDRIHVLVYIRHPVAHAASVWQQSVKRGGSTDTLDALTATFAAPQRVERVVQRLEELDGVEVTILNYSAVGDRLLASMAEWLGVPASALAIPPVRINRSLSDGELAVQLALNAELGSRGRLLADALCEELPDVEPAALAPSDAVQQDLWDRNAASIEAINARLDATQHYRFDRREPQAADLALSSAQLAVIGSVLGRALGAAVGEPEPEPESGPDPAAVSALDREEPSRSRRLLARARSLARRG